MAKKQINGITIAIDADTKGVTTGLKDLTEQSVTLSKQLKSVNALLDMDGGNTELMATKQALLAKQVETTKQKLEALKAAQDDVRASVEKGDIGTDEYLAFQRELIMTEKRLRELEGQSDDTGEEVKDLGKETKQTGTEMEKTEKESSKLGESLKDGLAAGAKAAGAAMAAVGAASVKLIKDVIEQTGELEQNLGGAESVFGEFADHVKKTGEDAYKNLGLSQSEYLATANKMGALLQGSGFTAEQSAEMTEKAMQRAADMASVMGIDLSAAMESVAGAAKGNFTMMDNLGVSINDTTLKAYAMEQGLGDIETTQDKVNVAMQLFLDKTKQYNGNFAKEATQTISGSFNLLSAAWTSLLAGLGDGEADISKLAGNVVDAFDAVVQNVEPVVDQIVESLPAVIDSLISAAERLLPKLIPSFTKIFTKLLDTLVSLLPKLTPVAADAVLTISKALIDNLPQIIRAGMQLIVTLAQGIAAALPTMTPQIVEIITEIVTILTEPKTLGALIDAAFEIITALVNGLLSDESINKMIDMVPEVVENIVDILVKSVDKLLAAAVEIIKALCDYFMDPENRDKIKDAAGKILDTLGQGCKDLVKNLLPFIKDVAEAWAEMFIGEIDYDATAADVLSRLGKAFVNNFFHSPQKLGEWLYGLQHLGSGDDGNSGGGGHFATGGLFTAPTRALIGENGAEVVLPLENNTGWMDILAAKLSGAGSGVTIGTINVDVRGADGVDDVGNAVVQRIDEALRNYQIAQARGIGGTAWDT